MNIVFFFLLQKLIEEPETFETRYRFIWGVRRGEHVSECSARHGVL